MKPLKQVAQAYMSVSRGEALLQEGKPEQALQEYRHAMEVTRTIPAEEVFDHDGFDALCNAGLADAFRLLGRHQESLEAAEQALGYFSRRGELHEDEGRQWITAVICRAAALGRTSRQADALKVFEMAEEMLEEKKGEMADREERLEMVRSSIATLRSSVPGNRENRKAWWEFWS
ncbi:MAG: DUF3856 domain-containing protein [Prosthecochloris sp.]|nr:DUF3856 domain-containing protein [Prosthecochloris sp.]